MKQIIPRGIGAFLAIASTLAIASPATAQNHPDKPLLWKVTGKDLKKPSYLFGTIHIGGPRLQELHPAAQKAFDESETLHTEIEMNPEAVVAATKLFMRDDQKTLSESVGADTSARLDKALKQINPALNITPFEPMQTWAITVTLPLLPEQLKGHVATDLLLTQKAAAAGKKNVGIEKMEEQLSIFSSLSDAEQNEFLVATLDALDESHKKGEDPIAVIKEPYIKGDAAGLQKAMEEAFDEKSGSKELAEKLKKALMTDRDKKMADHIIATFKDQPDSTQFFAVGAGHYCADKGIISHLKDAGYEVTRIEE